MQAEASTMQPKADVNRATHAGAPPAVGYKMPPAEHRFQKGRSGNPKGRPRKHPAAHAQHTVKNVEALVLEEAYRMVSIREGDKVIKLPAIQAVMRGLGVAAMKGDRRAQLAFKQHTEAVELKQHNAKMDLVATYLKYKTIWTAEFKRCDEKGLKRPDLWLHPDDIKIDSDTCEVKIMAPLDDFQKSEWDRMLNLKQDLIKAMAYEKRRARRRPELREETEKNLEAAKQMIDVIDFCWPDEATRRHPSYKRDVKKLPEITKLIKYTKPSQRADMALLVSRGPKARGE